MYVCVCVCCVCVYVVYLCNVCVCVCVHTQHSSIAASSPGSVHGVHISRFLPVPFIQLGILVAAIFAASLGPFIYQVCPTSHPSLPSQPHLMTCPMPGFFPTGTVEAGFVPPFPFQERSVPRLLGTQLLGSVQSAGQATDISWYRRGQVETGGGGGGRWRQEGEEGAGGDRRGRRGQEGAGRLHEEGCGPVLGLEAIYLFQLRVMNVVGAWHE